MIAALARSDVLHKGMGCLPFAFDPAVVRNSSPLPVRKRMEKRTNSTIFSACYTDAMDQKTKRAIIAHYKGQCQYCGAGEAAEVEHIVPLAKGGRDVLENVTLACFGCNRRKGDTELDVMFVAIAHARARDAAPAIKRRLRAKALPRELARLDIVDGVIQANTLLDLGRSGRQIAANITRADKAGYMVAVADLGMPPEAVMLAGKAMAGFCAGLLRERRGEHAKTHLAGKGGRKSKITEEQARDAKMRLTNNPALTHEQVARMLGVSRATLYRAWERHNIIVDIQS